MGNAESKVMWTGMRKALLLFATALVALALCSGVALAATKIGTDAAETLTGTNDNDRITGKGGDDITIGKKGNDLYNYPGTWNFDTVIDSGGKDALDFSRVGEPMLVVLCSDYTDPDSGAAMGVAFNRGGNAVVFGSGISDHFPDYGLPEVTETSHIENARGGPGYNQFIGCGLDNKMSGGGGYDLLVDQGGMAYQDLGTAFPASDEVYSGLGESGQWAVMLDGGGTDVANLKPYTTGQVDLVRFDGDADGTPESLVILTGQQSGIIIGDANNTRNTPGLQLDGRIEKVVFKDKTVSSTKLMAGGTTASASVRGATAEEGISEVLEDLAGLLEELEDPAGFLEDVQLP